MDNVIAALGSGDFEAALTHLWLEAGRTVNDSLQASVWQTKAKLTSEEKTITSAWLDAHYSTSSSEALPEVITASPLDLLTSLDEYLAQNTRFSRGLIVKTVVGDASYALIRRRFPLDTSAQLQAPNLGHWCRFHRVLPLQICASGGSIEVSIQQVANLHLHKVDEVICRLSHFTDRVQLCISEDASRENFFATGLDPLEQRQQSFLAELQQVSSDAAHLWVAPELTCPIEDQEAICQKLRKKPLPYLLLCIPGSFHHKDDQDAPRNTAKVLTGNGTELPPHHKLTQFSYPSDEIKLNESIVTSRRITLFDTPLGLVGIAICKDFSDAADPLINTAWDQLAPDWLLVPSYGDKEKTLHRHEERAKSHWSLRRTRSLVANQEPLFTTNNGKTEEEAAAPGFLCDSSEPPKQVTPGGSTFKAELIPKRETDQLPKKKPHLERIK